MSQKTQDECETLAVAEVEEGASSVGGTECDESWMGWVQATASSTGLWPSGSLLSTRLSDCVFCVVELHLWRVFRDEVI